MNETTIVTSMVLNFVLFFAVLGLLFKIDMLRIDLEYWKGMYKIKETLSTDLSVIIRGLCNDTNDTCDKEI